MKRFRAFSVPKEGNPADFCEDAWEAKENNNVLRCAVADGATDSFFSGFWARLLVSAYCLGDMSSSKFNGALDELQAVWMERVKIMQLPWYAEEKSKSGAFAAIVGLTVHFVSDNHDQSTDADLCVGELTSEARASEQSPGALGSVTCASEQSLGALGSVTCASEQSPGALGSVTCASEQSPGALGSVTSAPQQRASEVSADGVSLIQVSPNVEHVQALSEHANVQIDDDERKWEAFALGDSCLFQYRKGRLLHCLPLSNSDEFNSCPYLISSRQESNKNLAELFVRCEGRWEPGDQFFLMSDAIACWVMQQEEDGGEPLLKLTDIRNEDDFSALIAELRSTPGKNGRPLLKNDDVTVFHLSLPEEVI